MRHERLKPTYPEICDLDDIGRGEEFDAFVAERKLVTIAEKAREWAHLVFLRHIHTPESKRERFHPHMTTRNIAGRPAELK